MFELPSGPVTCDQQEQVIAEARVELNRWALTRNPRFPLTFRLAGALVAVEPTFPEMNRRWLPLFLDADTRLTLTKGT